MSLGRRHRHFWVAGWFVAAGLGVSGCSISGDDFPREPVAGTVLLDGKRLPYGTIMFYPEDHHEHGISIVCGDVIVNGRFSIPREKGPIPGKYTISISSSKKRPAKSDREPGPGRIGAPAAEMIPARFNSETELEVEVKEGGIKHLKIELDSK